MPEQEQEQTTTAQEQEQEQEQPKEKTLTVTQSELNEMFKERLARQAAQFKAEQEKAAREAEQKRLEEQNEYKPIAEQRKAELEKAETEKAQALLDVETFKAKAERYEAVLKKYADEQRKGLPDAVSALLDKLTVDEQLEWLAKNKSVVVKGQQQVPPPTPRGNNSGKTAEEIEQRTKAVSSTYARQF